MCIGNRDKNEDGNNSLRKSAMWNKIFLYKALLSRKQLLMHPVYV